MRESIKKFMREEYGVELIEKTIDIKSEKGKK